MLILSVAEDLHELFQDCCMATMASLCKLCGIVKMTINFPFMLVV